MAREIVKLVCISCASNTLPVLEYLQTISTRKAITIATKVRKRAASSPGSMPTLRGAGQ
jgi:hypothetical protein